jgi:hypothetical protein
LVSDSASDFSASDFVAEESDEDEELTFCDILTTEKEWLTLTS